MRLLLTLVILLLSFAVLSTDSKEIISKIHSKTEVKTFRLKNGINFSSYESEGSWENNLGNYGVNKCIGTVKKLPSNEKGVKKRMENHKIQAWRRQGKSRFFSPLGF